MAIRSHSPSPNYTCVAISFIGLAVSLYALYVEHNLDNDSSYRPLCDIAYYVSCSKAFQSAFANGLGVASSILGADHILTQVSQINIRQAYWTKVTLNRKTYGAYPSNTYWSTVAMAASSIIY
uniref:vitamin-K-epoxide reductase (warfarin-sensitive) n=2 Tax=Wuchereria bancrofti TaxID=6293 RepID=A0AAF5PPK9_WUCBA